ncbi:MAG: hypothetical protein HOV81_45490 [Kofleriaceae bacterium]|nr:hypothetical protein [Kofleriaceae bacterium]
MRAIAYAPDPEHQAWVEEELARLRITLQVSRSVKDLVAALVEDPPPRPQLLFADFSAMTPAEILHLHSIREQGWFGSVFALGEAPLALCQSMRIERILTTPLSRASLLDGLAGASHATQTIRIKAITAG